MSERGMRLAVNQISTFRWSLDEDLQRYRDAGFSSIGVWRKKVEDYGIDPAIDLIHQSGLKVSSLSWAGGFTGSDGRSHRESIEDGLDAVRLAGQIRAECLILYTGGRGGHTHSHAQRLVRVAMQELIDTAADCDVTLALEPMHPDCAGEWTFLTSFPATVEFLQELRQEGLDDRHRAVGIVLDAYQVLPEFANAPVQKEWIPQIALVQVADRRRSPSMDQDRTLLGQGDLPWADWLTNLVKHGYGGCVEVELLGEDIEDVGYSEMLRHSRQAVASIAPAGKSRRRQA